MSVAAAIGCALPVLTPDVRFEGWTTEEWIRFVRLWQPRATPHREPSRPRGGIVLIHEGDRVLKLIHTQRGRLDPSLRLGPAAASVPAPPPSHAPPSGSGTSIGADAVEAHLLVARPGESMHPGESATLERLARIHHSSWGMSLRLGALDEVMERFGARARRGEDLTAQALMFAGILRELIAEGAITTWPQRLRGVPLPAPHVVRRALDALCADGQTIGLGLFDSGELWTAFVARRRGAAFDLVAGPEELRPAYGLPSGDWRRDYRYLADAIEESYGPLGFGCFAELATFRSLQTDTRPGAWSRAVAVRDVVLARVPVAVGVALSLDTARYALRSLRAVTARVPLVAALGPALGSMRSQIARATGKDVAALLGFDPLEALRALLER